MNSIPNYFYPPPSLPRDTYRTSNYYLGDAVTSIRFIIEKEGNVVRRSRRSSRIFRRSFDRFSDRTRYRYPTLRYTCRRYRELRFRRFRGRVSRAEGARDRAVASRCARRGAGAEPRNGRQSSAVAETRGFGVSAWRRITVTSPTTYADVWVYVLRARPITESTPDFRARDTIRTGLRDKTSVRRVNVDRHGRIVAPWSSQCRRYTAKFDVRLRERTKMNSSSRRRWTVATVEVSNSFVFATRFVRESRPNSKNVRSIILDLSEHKDILRARVIFRFLEICVRVRAVTDDVKTDVNIAHSCATDTNRCAP